MNIILPSLLLLLLTTCSVPTPSRVEFSVPVPVRTHHIHRTFTPVQVPIAVEKPHEWTITEDRFITTHKPDVSVEALGLSREQIDTRLVDLDK